MRAALLVVLAALSLASAAHAQADSTAVPGRYRSPVAGHALGYLLPGGGHFYAGEPGTGLILLGATAAGTAMAFPGIMGQGICRVFSGYSGGSCELSSSAKTGLVVGTVLAGGAMVYSVVDGGRAVRRANVRNGHERDRRRVAVGVSPGGVAMRVRL